MKKTYIAPMAKLIIVKTPALMSTSGITKTNVEDLNNGGNTSDGGIVTGNARQGGLWDDGDE
jgi:hypothetical protein